MSLSSRSAWVYAPRPVAQPQLKLICLAHSGGGPALFRLWPADLPPAIEMLAVQLPGRGFRHRETPYERLSPLLQALVDALRLELGDAPFAFFGHSLGALLAFELTHALRPEQLEPQALFVSACHAPQQLPVGDTLHTLPRAELVAALQRMNGTPPELLAEEALLDMILPALRADMAVYETYVYRPRPALTIPLIACGGREDTRVTPLQLEAWREQAAGDFELHLFAGDHFYLNDARRQLIKLIEHTLAS